MQHQGKHYELLVEPGEKGGAPRWLVVVARATPNGRDQWRLRIDATKGDRWLMARGRLYSVGPYLFVRSDGEHGRGASTHAETHHLVTDEGKLAWSVEGPLLDGIRLGDSGLVVALIAALKPPHGEPPIVVELRDPRRGKVLASHGVPYPDDHLDVYERAGYPRGLEGKVKVKRARVFVEVTASFFGMRHHPLGRSVSFEERFELAYT